MPLPAPLTHQPPLWVWFLVGTCELVIRLVAWGVVPKRRRASTSTAWLLLIFLWPVVGVPPLSGLRILVGDGKVSAL